TSLSCFSPPHPTATYTLSLHDALPILKVLTPRDAALSAGIICFEVQGRTPEETVQRLLERKVIASTSPYKVTHARLAPSLVNDERQVEAAVRAVREIA